MNGQDQHLYEHEVRLDITHLLQLENVSCKPLHAIRDLRDLPVDIFDVRLVPHANLRVEQSCQILVQGKDRLTGPKTTLSHEIGSFCDVLH